MILSLAIVGSNLRHFYGTYAPKVRADLTVFNDRSLGVSDVVRRYTPEDSAVIVFGLMSRGSLFPISAWSSEVAYYSNRKSLTVSDEFSDDVWTDPAAFLDGTPLGAIVFCDGSTKRGRYRQILERYSATPDADLFRIHDCDVWLPGIAVVELPDGTRVQPSGREKRGLARWSGSALKGPGIRFPVVATTDVGPGPRNVQRQRVPRDSGRWLRPIDERERRSAAKLRIKIPPAS